VDTSGKLAGLEYLEFMGKCCTIFDFENCAVVNPLAAVLISVDYPLDAVYISVHPLEDKMESGRG